MKYKCHLMLFLALSTIAAQAEEVFSEICWFDRPATVERSAEGDDSGYDPSSWRKTKSVIFADSRLVSRAQMLINLRLIGVTIGNGKIVTIKPISDTELKNEMAMEAFNHSGTSGTNSAKVEETTLAGCKGLKANQRHADAYWVRVRPNKVLEVRLYAGSEADLALIRPWLGRLKIKISDKSDAPRAPLATNRMQLGLTQTEIHERCGEPVFDAQTLELYVTERYVVQVGYDARSTANLVSFLKIPNPQKTVSELFPEELPGMRLPVKSDEDAFRQRLPMSKMEVEKLLQQQAGVSNLTWSALGNNQWKRSDGAMAGFHDTYLAVATPEVWPKLVFPK